MAIKIASVVTTTAMSMFIRSTVNIEDGKACLGWMQGSIEGLYCGSYQRPYMESICALGIFENIERSSYTT